MYSQISSMVPMEDLLVSLPYTATGLGTAWGSNTTLTIAIGTCRDSTNVFDISVTSPITITASGVGVNGLDTGTLAVSTWYYVYVISSQLSDKPTAGLVSVSAIPTLPKGYNIYRRVGWAKTDGSAHFLLFHQTGRWYMWDASIAVLTGGSSATFAAQSLAAAVPPAALKTSLIATYTPAVAANTFSIRPTGSSVAAASAPVVGSGVVAAKAQVLPGIDVYPLLATGQPSIDYVVTASDALTLNVVGFEDQL